ncbi:MAG: DUF4062 domain-containing protein [Nitrospirae bacterium]|nr:DUF4062 domain-containing protein [Nitrospirota bacterium]
MADKTTSTVKPQDRSIRVFVSSTFRDMHAEREELVKRVFSRLRKMCEERGVTWGEVDLRWGITDEQKAEGKVLPICLAEIQRSRPYFIGLLGERYGWVPDEIPDDLIQQEKWLEEHRDHSVTELEILHGVLRNPKMAAHSFFYFRDPKASQMVETQLTQEPSYQPETDTGRQKLIALKEKIRKSGLPIRENYPDPKAFGELVLKDLTEVIDTLYPKGTEPAPLDREAAEHEAFAQSRAKVYIGRQEYFDRLDEHARGDGPPLVVLGESGMGKSALLANWALKYRETHSDTLLIQHFIGATPYSADWAAMLRRIMGEFKRRFGIEQNIPDKPDELRQAFANWLHMAAARGKAILILDGLNQIEDKDQAPHLIWLPPVIPSSIRLFLSTLPGKPLDHLTERCWPTISIEPIDPAGRKALIKEYLRQYTKELNPQHTEQIAASNQTANPLYLRSLLEELRLFGKYEELDRRISYFLQAKTIPDLYAMILERYEEDFEGDRPNLVRDTMTAIWAARRGLTETELLELLGGVGDPLPHAHWAPMHLAAEHALVNRSGLIAFAHDYVRQAVRDRYLESETQRGAAHIRLANYFKDHKFFPRLLDEEPWQLAQAKSWYYLYDRLSVLPYLFGLLIAHEYDVKGYWIQIENNTHLKMIDAYQSLVDTPGDFEHPTFVAKLVQFFADTGHVTAALLLNAHLIDQFRKANAYEDLRESLFTQENLLYQRGDFESAISIVNEVEQICQRLCDSKGTQLAIGRRANIVAMRGNRDEAMNLYVKMEEACRKLGDRTGLSMALGGQAVILSAMGHLDAAMEVYKKVEALTRESGREEDLVGCLLNQAVIIENKGHLKQALQLYKKVEQSFRALGSKAGIAMALANQTAVLIKLDELDQALLLSKAAERLIRELDKIADLQDILNNQALILNKQGNYQGAMEVLREIERICLEKGFQDGLERSLLNQGVVLLEHGTPGEALRLYERVEQVCRASGNQEGLFTALHNQALFLKKEGDLDRAMTLLKQAEQLCRETRNQVLLSRNLNSQVLCLAEYNDPSGEALPRSDEILPLAEEAYQLASDLGLNSIAQTNREFLKLIAIRFANRGEAAFKENDNVRALSCLREEERLYRKLGEQRELAKCLGNQGIVLRHSGDLKAALQLHKTEEKLLHETGNKSDLVICLIRQGLIHNDIGEQDRVLELYTAAVYVARESRDDDQLITALSAQAMIFEEKGNYNRAMDVLKEQEQICRTMGNQKILTLVLNQQANLFYKQGNLDRTKSLYEELEKVCRQTNDYETLIHVLSNHAVLLGKLLGRPNEALPLVEEASRLVAEHGIVSFEQHIKSLHQEIQTMLEGPI